MPRAVQQAVRLPRLTPQPTGPQADIARITIAGMAMIVGRPLDPSEEIDPLSPVVQEVVEVAAVRAGDLFAAALTPGSIARFPRSALGSATSPSLRRSRGNRASGRGAVLDFARAAPQVPRGSLHRAHPSIRSSRTASARSGRARFAGAGRAGGRTGARRRMISRIRRPPSWTCRSRSMTFRRKSSTAGRDRRSAVGDGRCDRAGQRRIGRSTARRGQRHVGRHARSGREPLARLADEAAVETRRIVDETSFEIATEFARFETRR